MAKLTVNNIGSGYLSTTALNDNFDLIGAALENTLSRDGTGPNQMGAALDMNGFNILNTSSLDVQSLLINGVPVIPTGAVGSELPSQLTHAGKFLQTNGSLASWQVPDATEVSFTQSGTGAVATTVDDKLNQFVSVLDFGADPTGVADSTTAFLDSQGTGNRVVEIPPGTFILNNLRIKNGVRFVGAGFMNTIIKQGAAGNYAINMLSDASVGQLLGCGLTGFQLQGHATATVAALNMEANGVYAIRDADIDLMMANTYQPLRMWCPDASNIYCSNIKLQSTTSAINVRTDGAYNNYDIFATGVASVLGLYDISSNSLFVRAVTENGQYYGGQRNTIINAKVENWLGDITSPATNICIENAGYDNTFINPSIITVPHASCNYGFKQGATPGTWVNPRIVGTVTTGAPNYPMSMDAGSTGTVIGFTSSSLNKIDSYTAGSILQKWSFTGDCSSALLYPYFRGTSIYVRSTPASGDTVTIDDNVNVLLIQNSATLAALTVMMPANPVDGQVITISCVQAAITALTVSPNTGQFVLSMPTTLAIGESFDVIWSAAETYWFRA